MDDAAPGAAWSSGDRFPTLAARDLERTERTLPDAFTGHWNLVLVAFRRQHQALVDEWVTWHTSVTTGRERFDCWEVPVIGTMWSPARSFIDGGMTQAVREAEARRHTLTVYTNVAKTAYALDITDTGTVTALLVDATGRIRWRSSGPPDDESTGEVLALVGGTDPA